MKKQTLREWCISNSKKHLLDEWDYENNLPLTPDNSYPHSTKKVNWICTICGNHWPATIGSRVAGNGCGKCKNSHKTSLDEKAVLYYISQITDTIPNYRAPFLGRMDYDIFIPALKMAIEYDGAKWHDEKRLKAEIRKNNLSNENGIELIRIREEGLQSFVDCRCFFVDPWHKKSLEKVIVKLSKEIAERLSIPLKIDVNYKRDEPIIYALKSSVLKDQCLTKTHKELILDWDYDANGILKPEMVLSGSHTRVHWKCHICGHKWQTKIVHRTDGHGCPNCAIEKIKEIKKTNLINSGNVLGKTHPELIMEWDYDCELNKNLSPFEISPGSSTVVGWKCSKCGTKWETTVAHRTDEVRPSKCPACAFIPKKLVVGKNDLASKKPNLAAEWDYEENYPLTPEDVFASSHIKVGWICPDCGLHYTAWINNRYRGEGCSDCRYVKMAETRRQSNLKKKGSLMRTNPKLAAEWDYEKNYPKTPNDIVEGSNVPVGWICSKCGHKWDATPIRRSAGKGCPECKKTKISQAARRRARESGNNLLKKDPVLALEWDYNKNELSPEEVGPHSGENAYWICSKCGHEWQALVSNRSKRRKCPECKNILPKPIDND